MKEIQIIDIRENAEKRKKPRQIIFQNNDTSDLKVKISNDVNFSRVVFANDLENQILETN